MVEYISEAKTQCKQLLITLKFDPLGHVRLVATDEMGIEYNILYLTAGGELDLCRGIPDNIGLHVNHKGNILLA